MKTKVELDRSLKLEINIASQLSTYHHRQHRTILLLQDSSLLFFDKASARACECVCARVNACACVRICVCFNESLHDSKIGSEKCIKKNKNELEDPPVWD